MKQKNTTLSIPFFRDEKHTHFFVLLAVIPSHLVLKKLLFDHSLIF